MNVMLFLNIRRDLMLKAIIIGANFHKFNDCNKMKFLFTNKDMIRVCAITCFKILQERRIIYINNEIQFS